MGCSLDRPRWLPGLFGGGAAGSIAESAFNDIAKDFGDAAASAVNWLWNQISGATAISLSGPAFGKDLAIVTTLAVVVATGLFVLQVIASVLRRDPSGLARALKGLVVAFVGSVAAIAVTTLLLAAVDSLSAGFVSVATGDSIQAMGSAILSASAITAIANPAVALLLSLVVLGAVIFVWGAMMIRKLLIIVAAVFTPLAFAGATSDLSTSWVRKWIETMVALVVSKLILVIIFVIGLGVLTDGLGEVNGTGSGASATQSITQTIVGTLILLMAGFAPWLAIKLVHFGGEHFGQIHGQARYAVAGAQSVAAAPRKAQSLAGGVGEFRTGGSGPSLGARSSTGDQAKGTPNGSASTVTSGHRAFARGGFTRRRRLRRWRSRQRQRRSGRGRIARSDRGHGGRGRCGRHRQDGDRQGDRPHRRGVVRSRPDDPAIDFATIDFATIDFATIHFDSSAQRSAQRPAQREVASRWVSAHAAQRAAGRAETCAARPESAVPPEGPAPVRFAQRSRRGLLLGLSAARCLSAGTAVCVVVIGLVAGGGIGLVASGLVWVPLLVATLVSWQGVALCPIGLLSSDDWSARRRPDRASTERECRCHARWEPWPFPVTPRRCVSTRTQSPGRAWCTTRIASVSRSAWRSPIRPTSCSRPPISRVGWARGGGS